MVAHGDDPLSLMSRELNKGLISNFVQILKERKQLENNNLNVLP